MSGAPEAGDVLRVDAPAKGLHARHGKVVPAAGVGGAAAWLGQEGTQPAALQVTGVLYYQEVWSTAGRRYSNTRKLLWRWCDIGTASR